MLCSQCQSKPATVHVETVVNGQATALNLCQACAQKGASAAGAVNFPSLSPILSALLGLLSQWNPPSSGVCPRCRWTLAHFRRTGKMGCPDCYTYFHAAARKILVDIQGSASNKGRKPSAEPAAPAKPRERKETALTLRHQLEKAIREERFEDAARLRDRLRTTGGTAG